MNLICEGLAKRQKEAFLYAAMGHGIKQTAKLMNCSIGNVESLRSTVLYKMHAKNMTNAVAEGFKRGNLRFGSIVCIFATLLCLTPTLDDHAALRKGRSRLRNRSRTSLFASGAMPPLLSNPDLSIPHSLIWDDGLYVEYTA